MKIIQEFPNYAIDENGIVSNIKTKRIKSQQIYNGYKYVQLYKNGKGKMLLVHRLVAEAFIPNPNSFPCVNHIDENKENNTVENLEWCTYEYNNHYGKGQPTIRAVQARKKAVGQYSMDGVLLAIYESVSEAQRITGINQTNISRCCLKRKWFKSAGGYVWRFADGKE